MLLRILRPVASSVAFFAVELAANKFRCSWLVNVGVRNRRLTAITKARSFKCLFGSNGLIVNKAWSGGGGQKKDQDNRIAAFHSFVPFVASMLPEPILDSKR